MLEMFTLWRFMTLLCITTPLWAAIETARDSQGGWVAYGLGVTVGVLVGGLCGWAMWTIGNIVGSRARAGWYSVRPWRIRGIYAAGALLAVIAGLCGTWITAALVRQM
jgi:hypothetical protein